ncbi:putative aspartate-tRNA ligase [Clavispora lusitaniae]|uniref:Aspartate-tRNA ligase n=1 Tax=Clavispora lusitaniae TaxID=36911 RepID=A0ACD0WIN4_CLALS|nr:putative aspartate-tRNA ligase [Clavispora lusitaniae]QFZ33529.1 putative aspartate-tRNA ligase [Clavispora lusitaniae]QFZ39200.1 putative aspartate-tRNA ligase [Clavispora lusitaniae]QFZ44882.1 putative aspartate-tRNA ligase [Clavispora lusitaniae]QFZ50559.1 putative aspartate-tRNA ligase [Clavispora lusitaniae]
MIARAPTKFLRAFRGLASLPPKETTLAKFVFPSATHNVKDLQKPTSDQVTVHGHLNRKPRIMAKRSFAELRDPNRDIIQIYMAPEVTNEKYFERLEKSGAEDSVSVTGYVQEKKGKDDRPDAPKQLELVVSHFQTLNPAGVEAGRLDKLKHSNPSELPPKYRFLQLRTPFYQKTLRLRSKAVNEVRRVLVENHDFVEIETPLLFKSTPEGAREFLVPTRAPDRFYALPQSPQQYKQILMSSGFTRYFQIARCFRDEDLRADRQPEFTQVDLEMSFVNHTDQVSTVIDDIIQSVWNKVGGLPIYKVDDDGTMVEVDFENHDHSKPAFNKLSYIEALSKYGIDKPDLRSALAFLDISKHFKPTKNTKDFGVVEACVLKGAFDPKKPFKVPHALTDSINYPKRKPIVLAIKTEEDTVSWYEKFVDKNVLKPTENFSSEDLEKTLNLQPGDILAFSTRAQLPYENPTPLGKFRQLAIEQFPNKWNRPILHNGKVTTDYDRNSMFVGSWLVDFPLFSPVEISDSNDTEFPVYDMTQLEATHHPFTMAKSEDYELLATDPLKVHGEHYDLVINGVEVGGGSRRVHDPELQKYIFESILKINNYENLFGHLLKALSMGCPPHAGIALGFDRLCAMLVGSASIRDVIAFPKNQSGTDPVVESPTDVPDSTLHQYNITKHL